MRPIMELCLEMYIEMQMWGKLQMILADMFENAYNLSVGEE